MTARRVWLGVIVLALSLALAMPAGAQKMKLIHWDWYEPRANLIKEFAARYHELNPDIEIETTLIPWDEFWEKLPIAISTGTAPDLHQFHNEKWGQFEGLLAPYPEKIFNFAEMREDYIMFDQAVMFDGKMYFFPAGIMTSGIFYNADILAAAGIDRPGATWAELLQQAKQLARFDQDGRLVRAGFDVLRFNKQYLYTDLVYQHGGFLFREDGGADLLSDESRAAVDLLMTIAEANVGPLPGDAFSGTFETGGMAMTYSWTWYAGNVNINAPELNYKVAPIPTVTGGDLPARARNNYEAGLAVPYNIPEERKEQAFRFIKWLYDQDDFYAMLNRELGRIPGRMDIWNHPILEDKSDVFRMLAVQVPYTVYPGPLPSWYFDVVNSALDKVFIDHVDPAVAFEQAQVEANARWMEEPGVHLVERQYRAP